MKNGILCWGGKFFKFHVIALYHPIDTSVPKIVQHFEFSFHNTLFHFISPYFISSNSLLPTSPHFIQFSIFISKSKLLQNPLIFDGFHHFHDNQFYYDMESHANKLGNEFLIMLIFMSFIFHFLGGKTRKRVQFSKLSIMTKLQSNLQLKN